MIIYYFNILVEYYTINTKRSIFDYVNSFICDNVDYFYNLDYKIDNFKTINCIKSNEVENQFVILEELENGNCEIKFANREYIYSIKKNKSYLKSSKDFLRIIKFREGDLKTETQEMQNMQNYSINLQVFYKKYFCEFSSVYKECDYKKFVKSFIEDNKEFFLERGFNLDYFTIEGALKYPILMTNRLGAPLSLGFTSEAGIRSYNRILLDSLSEFLGKIYNYPKMDKEIQSNVIIESKLDLENTTCTLNSTHSLLLIRRRKKLK